MEVMSHLHVEVGSNDPLLQIFHPLQGADVGLHGLLLHLPRLLQSLHQHVFLLHLQLKYGV